jgi:predicted branched-subunit amino acid permease
MNRSLHYDSQMPVPDQRTEEKRAYVAALASLLVIWIVSCMAAAVLVIALFDPGHLGLDGLLEKLGRILPTDAPILTT